MKGKKFLCVLLAAGMMITGLAGCGENHSSTEQAELKIHFHSNNKYTISNADGELYPVFTLAAEKTNVKIENVANPVAQNSLQEFQLQAAEQFPADIYGGTSIRNAVISYGYQGAFLPMNDLIDQYAPNIKKFLDENPEVKKAMTAADGNIYMLNYIPDGDVGRCYFIRTDWLEALNLEKPTTFEELETVLYAFRNNDPNQNGLKDEVPIFNDKWEEAIRLATLWGARVYGDDTFSARIVMDENEHFYHAWTADEFKEALIGLHQWYEDGILDAEVFTRKTNTARQTLWAKDNTGGMTHDFFASTSNFNNNEELLALVPDFKVEAILPVNKNGTLFEEHRRTVAKADGWAISAQTKNAEAAIKYMDWFYSEEGRRAINFGIEGDSYTMVDGKPIFTEKVLSQSNVNTYLQSEYGAQLPIGYKQDYAYEEQWVSEEGRKAYELYSANNMAIYSVPATPIVSFTTDEQKSYDECVSNVSTYMDETVTAFITGKLDIESNWDIYVAKCKELGSDRMAELYTAAYERNKSLQ